VTNHFSSKDTVLGLQALAAFGEHVNIDDLNLLAVFEMNKGTPQYRRAEAQINRDNFLVTNTHSVSVIGLF